jgi:hypothetical protein
LAIKPGRFGCRPRLAGNRFARLQQYPGHLCRPFERREVAGVGQGDRLGITQQAFDVLSLASFGLDLLDPIGNEPVSALNGFLAGILLGFDPAHAGSVNASYRVDIDGRRFEFAVARAGLAAADREPAVTVTASAADLVAARLGPTDANRSAALRRIRFDGEREAVEELRTVFLLSVECIARA